MTLVNREERGMHGYDILLELNRIFEGIWETQTGTIYPLLNKMASPAHHSGPILQGEMKETLSALPRSFTRC